MSNSGNRIGDYFTVMKPAIAFLNVFVGIAAILLAVGLSAPLWAIIFTSAAGFLSAAGAGAINCYIDRGLDKQMTRTRWRPIPAGRIPGQPDLEFGSYSFICRSSPSGGLPEPSYGLLHWFGGLLVHFCLHFVVETSYEVEYCNRRRSRLFLRVGGLVSRNWGSRIGRSFSCLSCFSVDARTFLGIGNSKVQGL